MPAPVLEREPLVLSPSLPDQLDPLRQDDDPPQGDTNETPDDAPPAFGRCPACGRPLRPRCRYTGQPQAAPVGMGYLSRARCDRCGTLIEYVGNGEWKIVTDADLTPDDLESDRMDRLMGYHQ